MSWLLVIISILINDEASTTPAQDQHSTTPLKQNPPPNNESPIELWTKYRQLRKFLNLNMKHRLDSVNMLTMVSNKTQNKCQESANNCYTSAMNDMGINFNRGRKSFKAKMWQKFGLAMEYLKISSAFLGVSVMISENICKIRKIMCKWVCKFLIRWPRL